MVNHMKDRLKSSHKQFKKNAKNTLYKGINPPDQSNVVKKNYLEDLSEHLHLPADILAGAPIITATGRNEINIENYKGIIEFDGSVLKVQTKLCKICIEGKKLNILYFTEDEMRVTGYIQAIYYR
jgi:sporulation protein YqfC